MKRLLWSSLVALLIPSAVLGDDDSPGQILGPIIGVENWFDGCAQLSQETMMTVPKMTLDTDCVTFALDYCTQRQTNSYSDICYEILTEHILLKSAEILPSLPANPNLKGFKHSSYSNALRRASDIEKASCESDISERECLLIDATLKWLDLRLAERLLEGERQ